MGLNIFKNGFLVQTHITFIDLSRAGMCGIIGCSPAIDRVLFQKGLNALAHRGPDGVGLWLGEDNQMMLGHRRLSVIDLSNSGDQPMAFEGLYLVFNGEIYNYIEIRRELMAKGYDFSSSSDSEVLLKAYHCWGEACQEKFNGMWAFAIYDARKRELFISRDRYGVKPLYYLAKDKLFLFASEVQAIQRILDPDYELNADVLQQISQGSFYWHGGKETYLRNVFVLPAGHCLRYRETKVTVSKWYELKEQVTPALFDDQASRLKELLIDACKLRLRSDVPVGTCLSGGVDSGSITSLINLLNPDLTPTYTHRSFCASFPNTPIDESVKASRLAHKLGSRLDIVTIGSPSIAELEMAMRQCDGPMHSLAFYPIWKLYQHIRAQGIVVTLDGQGPDEMLGGYRPLTQAIQYAWRKADLPYLWDVFSTYRQQGETAQVSARKYSADVLASTLKSEVKYSIKKVLGRGGIRIHDHPFRRNPFDEEMYSEFFKQPLPAILQQYDRCSMAHGVECRMPFMDFRIVEFIFSLPAKSRVGKGYTKRVLREAMKDVLPDETRLDRVKIGFNAPIIDWFRGPLKPWMLDCMNSDAYRNSAFFDGKKMKADFELFLQSDRPQWDSAWKFWGSVHCMWWKKKQDRKWN